MPSVKLHLAQQVNAMIEIRQRGNFDKTTRFLNLIPKYSFYKDLDMYGREGVNALAAATPIDTGETARSWDYEIHMSPNRVRIIWTNSNMVDGVPVAILVQYGHGNGSGYWVEGNDFINPALEATFDHIAEAVWSEVISA